MVRFEHILLKSESDTIVRFQHKLLKSVAESR